MKNLSKQELISYHADLQEMLMTCSEYLAMPELSSEEKTFFESTQSNAKKALLLINEQLAAHTSPANLKQDLVDLQAQIKTAKPLLAALKSGKADDKAMETVSDLLLAIDNWLSLVAMTPEVVQTALGHLWHSWRGIRRC